MNNNSQQIDRYLQNEMSEEEKSGFENQLLRDKALKEELIIQKQIMQAVNNAGIKLEFANAIKKRIMVKRIIQSVAIAFCISLILAIVFYVVKNNHQQEGEGSISVNLPAAERFDIRNATDTNVETKDGVVRENDAFQRKDCCIYL